MDHKLSNGTLPKFLIGTYCLTFLMWGSIIIANHFGFLQYGTPLFMILYLIGGNAPPIVAIVCLLQDKVLTAKQLFKTIFAVRQPARMYLAVIGFVALYFVIPTLLGKTDMVSPLYISLISLPLMVIGGGLEEIGWRFILQPALEKKFPFAIATVITAVIWAVWHLPLFLIDGTNQFTQNFGLFTISVFGLSFALAAIYRVSNSLWLCISFHSILNAVWESVSVEESIVSTILTAAILIGFSLTVVYFHHKTAGKETMKSDGVKATVIEQPRRVSR